MVNRIQPRVTGHDAAAAFRDSETWPLKGRGCAHCHIRPPVVWGLPFATGALCDVCLENALPGWSWERIVGWMERQRGVYIRQGERQAVWDAAERGDICPAIDYERKYGVWLLQGPRP